MVASASYFLTGHETTTREEGGWSGKLVWIQIFFARFSLESFSTRAPLVNDPETSAVREGRRRGILAREFSHFFRPPPYSHERSNGPFKKISE